MVKGSAIMAMLCSNSLFPNFIDLGTWVNLLCVGCFFFLNIIFLRVFHCVVGIRSLWLLLTLLLSSSLLEYCNRWLYHTLVFYLPPEGRLVPLFCPVSSNVYVSQSLHIFTNIWFYQFLPFVSNSCDVVSHCVLISCLNLFFCEVSFNVLPIFNFIVFLLGNCWSLDSSPLLDTCIIKTVLTF